VLRFRQGDIGIALQATCIENCQLVKLIPLVLRYKQGGRFVAIVRSPATSGVEKPTTDERKTSTITSFAVASTDACNLCDILGRIAMCISMI